ncbi:MAG: PAS domain S-box protein, partial [Anaerolineae bacterium]
PSNKQLNRLLEERTAELQQANQRLQQQVLEGQQAGERLVKINECFLSFQADPAVNINRLTALLGELLNAACALYNRLKDGMLCSTGQWNTPPGYNPTDNPEGHICYDVIRRGGDDIFVVRNLPHTPYAQTDPNVAPYGLQTYVGKAVKCNSSYVGSLCVVFQTDFEPTGDDEKLLGIIAAAISVEENRQRAEDELKQYRLHLEELVEARTAALSRTNEQLQNEIAGRNRIEAQLHNRAAELFTMLEVSKAISSTLDLEQVLALIAEQMVSVLNVSGCTLSRWDRAAGAVVTWVEKRRTNLQNVDQPGAAYPLDEFPATRAVLEQNRPAAIYLSDPAAAPAEAAFRRRLDTASLLMLPLAAGDRVIGLVELDDEAARRFTGAETRLAQALAKQAAIAIENARLYKETDRLRAFNQNIVQSLEEGIIMEDADGLISFTNPRAAEMLEYQPGELTGRHWQTIVAPDHRAKSKAEAAKRPHGIASRYETVCLTKTGRQVPVIVSARPLFNQNSFSGVLAVFTDITESKAAEKALKESEERFRTVANFTYDWEYWTDPDGNYLYVSPSCERITGYRADEFLSNQVQVISIMHPADRSAWASHFTEHLASDDACAFDFRIITRSGDVRWIGHVCQAVYSAGGRHLGRRAGNRDITGRKKAEEALQQRNRQLELLNHAGQAFIFTLNLNQVLENVLEEVRRLLSVTACSAWLVDADTGELVCRQVTDPQSKVVLGWRLKSGQGLAGWVAEHGQSLNVPDVREDKRHYKGVDKKTGLPLRSILTVPLRVKGDVIGVIQVVDAEVRRFNPSDQTLMESLASTAARAIENAQLYQALKTSQEYAQNLIDSSLDTIIAVDPKRNIVAFNRAAQETFGYLPDEIIGRHVDILYADPEESRAVHNTTISTGRCVQEVLNRHKDGHTFPSLISASVLRDADGELVGVMGVSRDITERKRIDQEREQLLASEREQRLVAETLREVTLSLTSQTSHEAVLDEILRQVQRLVPYSTAHIMLLKGKTLYSAHWRGYDAFDSEAWIASLEQPLDEYLLDYETVQSQKPLVITDTRQEPRWRTHAETR